MLRHSVIAACLLAGALSATTAHAQVDSPDFPGQLQPTLPANEQLVAQIATALPADSMDAVTNQATSALGVGTDLAQQLSDLLAIAPDDATRSRVEGVLTHVSATVDSLRMAKMETSLDSARARFDQARGEAQEALDELQPFVVSLPATMPIAGK
jgi:hypothetical protein